MPPIDKATIATLIEQGLPVLDDIAQANRGPDVKAAITVLRSMAADILGRVPEPVQTTDASGALSRALKMMKGIEHDSKDPLRNAYARARDILTAVLHTTDTESPDNDVTQLETGGGSEIAATIAELRAVLVDARRRQASISAVKAAMAAACKVHPGNIRFAQKPATALSATFITREWEAIITPEADGTSYTIFVESLTEERS